MFHVFKKFKLLVIANARDFYMQLYKMFHQKSNNCIIILLINKSNYCN
jgi:hypothetical protein